MLQEDTAACLGRPASCYKGSQQRVSGGPAASFGDPRKAFWSFHITFWGSRTWKSEITAYQSGHIVGRKLSFSANVASFFNGSDG